MRIRRSGCVVGNAEVILRLPRGPDTGLWEVLFGWYQLIGKKMADRPPAVCARSVNLARVESVRALRHYQTWTAFTRGGPDLP
jgi:hypothetical protein